MLLKKISFFTVGLMFIACTKGIKVKQIGNDVSAITTSKKIEKNNLNISFLLDLSDRINPEKYPNETMEFYMRDVAYIKSISEVFDKHLRKKRVRHMNDKIQVYFDPAPKNKSINSISSDLKYFINRHNASIDMLDDLAFTYSTRPLEIYNLAIKDNKYVGSDIWNFFKNKVTDYCVEEGYRNILIILTDGYIYHRNSILEEGNKTSYLTPQIIRGFGLNSANWEDKLIDGNYGFITETVDLEKLEVLVLGVNADVKNPYEEDVVRKYWIDWLESMSVKHFEVRSAEIPSDMEKLIEDFILNY